MQIGDHPMAFWASLGHQRIKPRLFGGARGQMAIDVLAFQAIGQQGQRMPARAMAHYSTAFGHAPKPQNSAGAG